MHASAAVATELLKLHQPPELQVLGYTLLQHLVRSRRWQGSRRGPARHACWPLLHALKSRPTTDCRRRRCAPLMRRPLPCDLPNLQVGNRWDEFSPEEHSQLATLAYSMLQQGE